MHKLIVQETSHFFKATSAREHLDGIWRAEVHIRLQRDIEVFDGVVSFKAGCRPIIHEVHFGWVDQIVVKFDLISEEWFEVGSVHKLSLSLVYLLKHLAFTHCCHELLSESKQLDSVTVKMKHRWNMDLAHVLFQLGEIPGLGCCTSLRVVFSYFDGIVKILVSSRLVKLTSQVLVFVFGNSGEIEVSNGVQV